MKNADMPAQAVSACWGKGGYTPGPWRCLTNGEHYVVMREGQGSRGVLLIEAKTKEQAEADARLIAAAPALVEALKEARQMVDEWGAYASPYFQEKHNLQGDLAKLDAALKAAGVEL